MVELPNTWMENFPNLLIWLFNLGCSAIHLYATATIKNLLPKMAPSRENAQRKWMNENQFSASYYTDL